MRSKALHTLLSMIMTATIILVWSHATQADMIIAEKAYELRAKQIALPTYDNAQVTIRTCPECDAALLRVNGATRYFIGFGGSPALNRRAFMEAVAPTLNDDDSTVGKANLKTLRRLAKYCASKCERGTLWDESHPTVLVFGETREFEVEVIIFKRRDLQYLVDHPEDADAKKIFGQV